MVLFRSRAVRAAVLTVSLGIFAAASNAQQARFTLPFEAHWGSVVLPAGEYKMDAPLSKSWPRVLSIAGQGRTVYLLAAVESPRPESEQSYLKLVNVGGTQFVTEFRSGVNGKLFTFEIPKAMRSQIARGTGEQTTKVAVMTRH